MNYKKMIELAKEIGIEEIEIIVKKTESKEIELFEVIKPYNDEMIQLLSKSKKIIRDLIMQINDFPIMNPEIVTAIGLMLFFITIGVERGFATLLIAHIAFCIPYVMLSVMPKIRSLDPNLADAAMDLGCTPWQALTKVIVPQIMPGIVSGALIAFTMSFDDFIISYFVTGKGIKNLSLYFIR